MKILTLTLKSVRFVNPPEISQERLQSNDKTYCMIRRHVPAKYVSPRLDGWHACLMLQKEPPCAENVKSCLMISLWEW